MSLALVFAAACAQPLLVLRSTPFPQDGDAAAGGVDLDEELVSPQDDHVLARPWFENLDVWGYGAFVYLDSGDELGVRPEGSFLVHQATLFFDAQVWEDTSLYVELQVVRFDYDYDRWTRSGELYARFHDLFLADDGQGLDLKAGRVDIPFGEEYLWQDAPDNPLFSQTAAFPYGSDEGLVLSDGSGRVGWAAALLDGSAGRSNDVAQGTLLAGKVWGEPRDDLYASLSVLASGETTESSLLLGRNGFAPVGSLSPSSAGTSPSETVEALAAELDLRYELGARWTLSAGIGGADIDDPEDDAFDRELLWYFVEPRWELRDDLYAVLRYSAVATGDDDEGYLLDGKPVAWGRDYGYDTRRLTRLSAGLGWEPNPRTLVKLEVGEDDFDLIDGSPYDDGDGDRRFVALGVVVSF